VNRRPDFALWCGLLVAGAWSTVVVLGLIGGVVVYVVATAFHMPAADGVARAVGFYAGRACTVVAPFTVAVGVPLLARRCRAGFWRGLFAVTAATVWLVLPSWFLFVLIGPVLAIFAATGLNFVAAVVCAVILRRRRRARRLEAPSVADVFS
jgi:hypothetical protein